MIIDWSVASIKHEINKIKFKEGDPYMDGYNTWQCKKDLYEILWHVQNCLQRCSTYSGEDEFLREHDKAETWKVLNED